MQKNLDREKKMFLNFTGPIKLESDLAKEQVELQQEDEESNVIRSTNKSLLGSKFNSNTRPNLNKTSKLASTASSNILDIEPEVPLTHDLVPKKTYKHKTDSVTPRSNKQSSQTRNQFKYYFSNAQPKYTNQLPVDSSGGTHDLSDSRTARKRASMKD